MVVIASAVKGQHFNELANMTIVYPVENLPFFLLTSAILYLTLETRRTLYMISSELLLLQDFMKLKWKN